MDIIFEDPLKDEEKQLIEEYYAIKKQLNELSSREELLKNNIKKLMSFYNLKNINTNRIDLMLRGSEKAYYPKSEIERNVSSEILDKIRKMQKITVLISRIKG